MATIDFDWGRFVDSQYYGHPKNGNWKKFPQWADEVVPSNPASWTGDLGTVRDDHRLVGYTADVYRCQCGEEGVGDWMDHVSGIVATQENVDSA